jgi:hypothetical protein
MSSVLQPEKQFSQIQEMQQQAPCDSLTQKSLPEDPLIFLLTV